MSRETVIQVNHPRLQGFIGNHKLRDILFFVESGSAIWGMKTETSDTDFTGVYIPTIEECITGSIKDVISQDSNPTQINTPDDVDIKLLSIHHFVKNLIKGDSDSVAILFAPKENFLYRDERWKHFKHFTPRFISRSMVDSAYGGAKSRMKEFEKTDNPKMLYHACRFSYVAYELLKHQRVCLPIRPKYRELFMQIKSGNVSLGLSTFNMYQSLLGQMREFDLPKPNYELGKALILSFY